MGICCSKTSPNFSTPTPISDPPIQKNPNPNPQIQKIPEQKATIKEKHIINHTKSNEIDRKNNEETPKPDQKAVSLAPNCNGDINLINDGGPIIRTSSCTRDEVDAILIHCGRLSRSSSAVQTPISGRKRSHDFDQEERIADVAVSRESRGQSRPSPHRRRTPSRERERERDQNQHSLRSGSKERNSGGRRVSRSPGKRSESPIATCHNPSGGVSRPGKMVSVPATVSSLAMDKSNNGERLVTKRNAAASPRRSRSPAARASSRVSNEMNQNQLQGCSLVLSRSNLRRAELSPYRRNPLDEIDQNAVNNSQKQAVENENSRTKTKEPPQAEENAKAAPLQQMMNKIEAVSGPEPLNPPPRTHSRRLSRDLDNLKPQNPSPPSSYTSLLLKDIQNFHSQTPNSNSLPCLSKTCSILEQIADLNSNNKEKREKRLESKETPLVGTEVVRDDLIEPSFQKYVTVKRGNVGRDEEREESSGSNSFVGGPQHWISSSLWETNSTDSTDCWASSSRSNNTRDSDGKKREIDLQKMGIGKGRADFSRGVHSRSAITAATI